MQLPASLDAEPGAQCTLHCPWGQPHLTATQLCSRDSPIQQNAPADAAEQIGAFIAAAAAARYGCTQLALSTPGVTALTGPMVEVEVQVPFKEVRNTANLGLGLVQFTVTAQIAHAHACTWFFLALHHHAKAS